MPTVRGNKTSTREAPVQPGQREGTKKATGTVTYTHGTAAIGFSADLALDDRAGNMTPDEVLRTPKPPLGIGLICDKTAAAMEKDAAANGSFTPPKDVTPALLREAGRQAEDIDLVIRDIEVLRAKVTPGNRMKDAYAWDTLRAINHQVKAPAKRNPGLLTIFADLVDYMAKGPRAVKNVPPEGGGK